MKKDKISKNKIITIVGNILMIVSVFFIAKYIYEQNIDFAFLKERANIIVAILLILLSSVGVICLAMAWKNNLETISKTCIISKEDAIWLCSKANLARYIPGNVAHYASRNIIGIKYNLQQETMVLASVMEIVLVVLVGGMIIISLMYADVKLVVSNILMEYKIPMPMLCILVILIVSVGIAFIFCYCKKRKYRISSRQIAKSIKSIIIYTLFHFINVVVFGIMIIIIFEHGSLEQIVSLGGCYLSAWIIGMLTPGAPGGIGIREYVLLFLLKNQLAEDIILQLAVLMRIITVGGDIVAAIIGVAIHGKKRLVSTGQ